MRVLTPVVPAAPEGRPRCRLVVEPGGRLVPCRASATTTSVPLPGHLAVRDRSPHATARPGRCQVGDVLGVEDHAPRPALPVADTPDDGRRRGSPAVRVPRDRDRRASVPSRPASAGRPLALAGSVPMIFPARRPAQATVASDDQRTVCELMFVPHPTVRLRAVLHKLYAASLELVTLGEVRLAPPRARSGVSRDTTRRARWREDARAHPVGLPGRVPSLSPEFDGALERRLESGAAGMPHGEPDAAAGLEARGRGRPVTPRRHGNRLRSGRPPVRFWPRPQTSLSSAQPSSPLSRTMRTSPSRDVATKCARSSRTPGRSSTRTSSRSS